MFVSCLILGMVGAAPEPTLNCKHWPHADRCEGEVFWNSARGICECRSRAQLLNQPVTHRVLQQLGEEKEREYFKGCYSSEQEKGGKLKIMMLGILVDRSVYETEEGDVDQIKRSIYAIVNFANMLFEDQMSIRIRVGTLYIAEPGHTIPRKDETGKDYGAFMDVVADKDNDYTCPGISPIEGPLDFFSSWVSKLSNDLYALWHLFTICKTGVNGRAVVATLCSGSGTGYTSWNSPRNRVFAHEIGHNFGADHTFHQGGLNYTMNSGKGIMDYDDNVFKGFVQFHPGHQPKICTTIKNAMHMTSNRNLRKKCWADDDDTDGCPSSCRIELRKNGECNAECYEEACAFDFGDCDYLAEPNYAYTDLGAGSCRNARGGTSSSNNNVESEELCKKQCTAKMVCTAFYYNGDECRIYTHSSLTASGDSQRAKGFHCWEKGEKITPVLPKVPTSTSGPPSTSAPPAATTTPVLPTPSTPAPSPTPTTVAPTHDPNTSTKDGKGGSDSAVTTGIVLSVLIVAAAIIIILGVCWKRKGDASNDVKPRIPADQTAKRTSLKRAQGRKPKKKPKSLKYQKDRLKPKEASPHDQNQDKKQESKSRKSKRDALRE
eukprot:GEMP01006570.1.p1 GENE.GEMP01006570.1~~GEMP01006570.1.p1  ORF type:complete len:604 (+),score=58.48 GEMP01006570.1:98-1909(+)